jgi:hypothetical protein
LRLFWVCILLLTCCRPVYAALDQGAARLGYQIDWREEEELRNKFDLNLRGKADWLRYDVAGSFYAPQPDSGDSALNVRLDFPRWNKNLKLHSGVKWNEDYRYFSERLYYRWLPSRDLHVDLDYTWQIREAERAESSRYEYHLNQEELSAYYLWETWRFFSSVLHAQKTYPAQSIYTSTKWQLEEDLSWQCRDDLQLGFAYREVTGFYPFDKKINYDYWRCYYEFRSRFSPSPRNDFFGSYRISQWEKGLRPYRDDRKLKLSWTHDRPQKTRILVKLELEDIGYLADPDDIQPVPDEDDEDEAEDEAAEEDYHSRRSAILSLEYRKTLSKFSWTTQVFFRRTDYRADAVPDSDASGVIVKLRWKQRPWELHSEWAPFGGSRSLTAYYRLKMVYNI